MEDPHAAGSTTTPPPAEVTLPDKRKRPRAFEESTERYQWHFGAIPKHICQNGKVERSPFRKVAVYVVHGIGKQVIDETAVSLRLGIEEAVTQRDPQNWDPNGENCWIVPEPYIFDGYWANYSDFELTAPLEAARLEEAPRNYFKQVWRGRLMSAAGALRWLFKTGSLLIGKSIAARRLSTLYYLVLVPLLWLMALVMWVRPKWRTLLEHYAGDVPLYVDPRGDVQNDVVQRIDRRVGSAYLQLIGLDWNLEPLKPEQCLVISGEHHRFDEVVWVSHSLGTVISYNVIGDLLELCHLKRQESGGSHPGAERLEKSLKAFVTLGSPLDKIYFLFGDTLAAEQQWPALRPWPEQYLPQKSMDKNPDATGKSLSLWDKHKFRWYNFFYAADPVSGSLDSFEVEGADQRVVTNYHTPGFRLPGVAHLSYWKDSVVLEEILSIAFDDFVIRKPVPALGQVWIRVRFALMSIIWIIIIPATLSVGALLLWRQYGS